MFRVISLNIFLYPPQVVRYILALLISTVFVYKISNALVIIVTLYSVTFDFSSIQCGPGLVAQACELDTGWREPQSGHYYYNFGYQIGARFPPACLLFLYCR